MSPMTSAESGVTTQEAGVIAPKPATAPEMAPSTLGFPPRNHSAALHPTTAAAAPKWVATKALVARLPEPSALPALNPNQPTHNNEAPTKLSTTLCGGMGICGYPRRLPM